MSQGSGKTKEGFTIFRAVDAPELLESGCITPTPMPDVQMDGMRRIMEAGYRVGDEIKVLCNIPYFSLVYTWFKPGLPLHSHGADCLYYIASRSLRLGTEEPGPRDTFFIPSAVPSRLLGASIKSDGKVDSPPIPAGKECPCNLVANRQA